MRNAAELGRDTKAEPVPRGKRATCVKMRGEGAIIHCGCRSYSPALTGERQRDTE